MSTKDLQQFFSHFSESLQVLAREGRHVELEAKLESLSDLLDAWLDVIPENAEAPSRSHLFVVIERFDGPLEIDLRKVVEAATLSKDTSTLVALMHMLARYAFRCLRRNQPALAREFLDTSLFSYYRCDGNDDLLDAVGLRLDSMLNSLLTHVVKVDAPVDTKPDRSVFAVLRFAMGCINAAIRMGVERDAEHFIERLVGWREYRVRPELQPDGIPLRFDISLVFDYLSILLIGWALDIIDSTHVKCHGAAKLVLQRLAGKLPSRQVLIAQWELIRRGEYQEEQIESKLGVSNWDVRDWDRDYRPGIVTTRSGGSDWPARGLRAALLLASGQAYPPLDELSAGPADRYVWDTGREETKIRKLADHKALAIPEKQAESRIQEVVKLIGARARGSSIEYLKNVLSDPLSSRLAQSFRSELRRSWREHRSWIDALGNQGVHSGSSDASPLSTEVRGLLPREWFLDRSNVGSGYGQHLGEDLGRSECIQLFGVIAEFAERGEDVRSLASLPEVVRRAVRVLSEGGHPPNLLVLPDMPRFAGALFRKPLWQVEGRLRYPPASIGDWEGLHVLKFPYTNPASILLMNTGAALAGDAAADDERALITIEDESNHPRAIENRQRVDRALQDLEAEVPPSTDVLLGTRVVIHPALGIKDHRAAIALSIEHSDGGFAILSDSDLYHRPSCPDIQWSDVTYVLEIEAGSKRKPCPKCRPDTWDREGRMGQVAGPEQDTQVD